ncbi:MAG: arylsulfatase [Verrucomicrobia bacterium]|nr:arylsulfatase [Verrucomicrobiota bacterium]
MNLFSPHWGRLFATVCFSLALSSLAADKPNLVVILADDIGYGDLGCYGATRIKTPNLDRLAREGLRFTDAYAPASVCTPTRYSLITGEYAWRNPVGAHILPGVAPLSIRPGSTTLPGVLKQAGYATAIVGKWHLGLGPSENGQDWNGDIKPGPLEVGFTDSFIIPATGDRVPCVFIKNHRIVGLDPKDPIAVSYGKRIGNEPTGANPQGAVVKLQGRQGHDQSLVNGIPRIGFMTGGQKARWVDEEIPATLVKQAVAFLETHQGGPFFLYFAAHDIHAPRVPNARWKGTSQAGVRGDVSQQLDWQAGEILAALDRLKLTDHTLVFFASDNGGTMQNGYDEGESNNLNGHSINGPLRGFKGSLLEGGVRVPLLARWPGHIKPGTETRQIASLVDLTATAAAITGQKLPAGAAPDSFSLLPLLASSGQTPARDHIVVQQNGVRGMAIRQGDWKYIPGGEGRRGGQRQAKQSGAASEGAEVSGGQLFNLAKDLGESQNVAAQHPDVVAQLSAILEKARSTNQTRP